MKNKRTALENSMPLLSRFIKHIPLFLAGFLLIPAVSAEQKTPVRDGSEIASSGASAFKEQTGKRRLDFEMEYEIRPKQKIEEANKKVSRGNNAFQTGDFENAIKLYFEAREILQKSRSADAKEKAEKCLELISQAYYYWAEKLYLEAQESANLQQYDQAIENCRKAAEMYPKEKERMDREIERFKKMRESAVYQNSVSEKAVLPDKDKNDYEIAVMLRQGDAYYHDGQWDKARDKYEDVISKDPYNMKAITGIRNANYRLLAAARSRQEMTHSQFIAEMEWKSLTPLAPKVSVLSRRSTVAEPIVKNVKKNKLLEKLKTISQDFNFEDIPLPVIIREIREKSKERDPEKEGVNILLITKAAPRQTADETKNTSGAPGEENLPGGPGGNQPQAAPAAAPAAEEGESDDEESGLKCTLQTGDAVPLIEALGMLEKVSGYRMRIDENAVVFAAPDVLLDQIERRSYPYDRAIISSRYRQASAAGGGGGGTEAKASSGSNGSSTIQLDPVDFLGTSIPFTAPGSGLFYNELTNRLIVLNTPTNLARVEELLSKRKQKDAQVLIQTKFSEVQLNDLEELGFQYLVSRQNANVTEASDGLVAEGRKLTITSPDGLNAALNKLGYDNSTYNLYSTKAMETGYSGSSEDSSFSKAPDGTWYQYVSTYTQNGTQSANMQNYFSNASEASPMYIYAVKAPIQEDGGSQISFGQNSALVRSYKNQDSTVQDVLFNGSYYNQYGYKINATVSALDQADSTDMLASPRLTTINGYDAVIKMVDVRYFPKSWSEATVGTIAAASGSGNVPLFTPSIPTFGSEQLGIVFGVKPQVDPDDYTITMLMTPSIRQWTGWTDYSYNLYDTINGKVVEYKNTLKMPVIENRSVNTSVQCYDGETIVLGGVIKDEVSTVNDQYPILGTVPIVGRLFQSKSKISKKKNLLIFMSCRLVNPDGSPLREREMRGLPPFRQ